MHNLEKAGLGEGDLLSIALPTGTPYPVLLLALFRMGAVACPVNPRFPGRYLLDVLKSIQCQNIVVPYGTSETTYEGELFTLAPSDIVDEEVAESEKGLRFSSEQPVAVVLTSGSTGLPKAALLSYDNLYYNAQQSNANLPLEPGARWLLSLPLYHVSGLGILFRCLLAKAAVVIPAPNEGMVEAIVKYGVTHVSLVPTQLYRLMKDPTAVGALRQLKAILLGGSAISETLLKKAYKAGLPVYTTYGLTEMGSQVTTTPPGASRDELSTSGRALDPMGVHISDGGEILVGGRSLFLGYVVGSGLRRPLTDTYYFATGDLGQFDREGFLHVTGRRDNQFIVGGENVQPEEVEKRLCRIAGVLQAVVVPVEDEELGTIPVAFLRLAGDSPPDEKALTAHLAQQLGQILPKYKIPRHCFIWPEEGVEGDLKIKRSVLIDLAQARVAS
jgi:O-succinylbenzoic acid--CoA ligase